MCTTILGIESSCDETSAALWQDGKIINNIVATQSVHEQYGGVVPELASRAHQKNIIPVVQQSLSTGKIALSDISAIAYTQGPGLLGALLVGSSFAKAMAMALGVPTIEVNHMQAHVLAHFIDDPKPAFPFLCLTVSGGHTQIMLVKSHLDMEVVGQTLDDAAGEAFDKGAKLLNLPYPGGHHVDRLASTGDAGRFAFPKSGVPGLDYSFSGIKTSLLCFLRKKRAQNPRFAEENIHDICAGYQHTLIEMLTQKLVSAAQKYHVQRVAVAGGVSANQCLRGRVVDLGKKHGWEVFIPKFEYCTDNAAMIAITGYFKFMAGHFGDLRSSPQPRMCI